MSAAAPYSLLKLANGYRRLRWPDHPIASREGYISEHRAAFYDNAGPGPHSCHWCDRPLHFASEAILSPALLVVDHLDGDKLNNAPDNLAPSCPSCNAVRGRHKGLIEARREARLLAGGGARATA